MSETPQLPTSDPALKRLNGTFSGGWRPNPGVDETVNVPYDVGGHRVE
jgi:hypothetical protein